jgi:hypothetical protein
MLLIASIKRIDLVSLFFLSVTHSYDACDFHIASTNARLLDRRGSHRGIS